MVLNDGSIRREIEAGRLKVDPFDPDLIQPSSIDIRLDRYFQLFHNTRQPYIDLQKPTEEITEAIEVPAGEPFMLHPGEFVLAQTLEYIELPHDLVARLEGKSSLGRLGLVIHSTAGFVDPGWAGNLTLELSNLSRLPIQLTYGIPIGQISFFRLEAPAERPYGDPAVGSKYHGQTRPTASRFHLNFEDD